MSEPRMDASGTDRRGRVALSRRTEHLWDPVRSLGRVIPFCTLGRRCSCEPTVRARYDGVRDHLAVTQWISWMRQYSFRERLWGSPEACPVVRKPRSVVPIEKT
jgi:hypothetical protein